MNSLFKIVGAIVAGIALLLGLMWGSIRVYAWLAPQQKAAERRVFEETPSFVHGKIQYLSRLRLQYNAAEGNQREALRQLILMEASSVNPERLPPKLRRFLEDLE